MFPSTKSLRVVASSAAFINGYSQTPFFSSLARADDSCQSTTPGGKIHKVQPRHFQHQRSLLTTTNNKMSANDELAKAQGAAPEEITIFDKIVAGDIPCTEVYSDDRVLAFRDVNPQGPVHIVVIPKNRDGLSQLTKARPDQKELLGHLMYVGKYSRKQFLFYWLWQMTSQPLSSLNELIAQDVGKKECPGGFRVVINDGKDGAQVRKPYKL